MRAPPRISKSERGGGGELMHTLIERGMFFVGGGRREGSIQSKKEKLPRLTNRVQQKSEERKG